MSLSLNKGGCMKQVYFNAALTLNNRIKACASMAQRAFKDGELGTHHYFLAELHKAQYLKHKLGKRLSK